MKKNLFMVAAVALMALVSCSKENFNDNTIQSEASDIVFSAELEQPAGEPVAEPAEIQSKTSLGTAVNGVRPVSWVKDDQIKINGVTFKAASAGSRTDFTPTGSFNTVATYYAVYPATATSKADHSAITIPASQDGSFAKAAISVAKSTTTSLSFKNVASIIKFQVPAACSTVTISSSANLAGTFPVTFGSDGLPVVGTVSSASKTITLTGSFKTGTDYYVAVLPGSHKFTVRLNGYLSKASTKAVSTTRANIANLQKLPELEKFEWGIVGQHQGWDITKPTPMYKVQEKLYAVLNVKLQSNGFKFAKHGLSNWDTANTSFGAWKEFSQPYVVTDWYQVYTNNLGDQNKNLGVADWNKAYDVYIYVVTSANWGKELKYKVVETGTSITLP